MLHDPVEDDELLAPQGLGVEDTDDLDDDTDDLTGDWQAAHGYPDTRRAVRIWVDEDTRHLTKMRLSTRWRDRLGTHKLEDALAEAFFLANARVGDVPTLAPSTIEVPEGDPNLTWADHPRISEQIQTLLERVTELSSRAPDQVRWADFQGEQVTASSSHGHCTVTLSLAGLTDSVALDKKWLRTARMGEVVEAVLKAHEKAYAAYQPPVFVPGEHEELAAELAQAQGALQSIVSKGI
ncbi:hypothetical protein BW730_04900 [Tessaracoccus aquimaris]|uniref:Uncharacterized protein n=1 Tax=Tessaracoccus aquimaris TaxID=1332264 RepID=A0A1Q2CLH3_9ACTN|nr:hypothetical protein [Tessaracoccus aquimaris]AQP46957.1 hypothetical protein BW730_04900 [Tessaracoccus aquimaris]